MTGLDRLLAAMAAACRRCAGAGQPGAAMAAAVAERIAALEPAAARPDPAPRPKPDSVPLDDAMARALAGPEAALAGALRPILPGVSWSQTYSPDQIGQDFVDRCGYFDVAGPGRAMIPSATVATGFMIMGPGLLYPEHFHPAEELYFVLAGAGTWRYGDGPWRAHAPGDLVFTPSRAVHAICSNAATLFLMYAWQGDLATSATLGRPATAT